MNQLNAGLRNVLQDLVERRLWPVALVLVVALIAIPVLLSSPASNTAETPAPAPAVAPATGTGSPLPAFEPVVSTEGSKSSEIKKNLSGFETKDPFKVQGLSSGGSNSASGSTAAGDAGSATPDTGSGTQSGSGGTGSQGSPTTSDGTGQSGLVYYVWTATVRWGIGNDLDTKRLQQFRALPSSQNPVVVFMGVTTDGKNGVFMVSAASGTKGDGDCEPDDTCTFLYMTPGQEQTFEAVNADDKVVTYRLRLTDLDLEVTDTPANTSSRDAKTRAERRARRAQRIARDKRDEGFAKRIVAVGF